METNLNIREYFKSLTTIYYALMAGQIFFLGITLYLYFSTSGLIKDGSLDMAFIIATLVFTFLGIFGSNFVFKLKLNSVRIKEDFMSKLAEYRSALIIRWALIEGPCFFAIVTFMLTGNLILFGMAVLILLNFVTVRPSSEKMILDMDLNQTEVGLVRDAMDV